MATSSANNSTVSKTRSPDSKTSRESRGVDGGSVPTSAESVGTKADPVCIDPVMVQESMTPTQLATYAFQPDFSLLNADIEVPCATSASYASSKSSRSSGLYPLPDDSDAVLVDLQRKSESINHSVKSRTISRLGRSTQRWVVDPESNNLIRLVVGCIPILKDGRVLMVSASKKSEWILPKGGWELDESMEESAIRETFEEAGVVGVLGPKLSDTVYETRKAKQKRLSLEENLKKGCGEVDDCHSSSGWSVVSQLSEDDQTLPVDDSKPVQESSGSDSNVDPTHEHKPSSSSIDISRKMNVHVSFHESAVNGLYGIKPKDKPTQDEISAGSSSAYTHVRLAMFPLYVTEVKHSWPESRRLRKAVDINEAMFRLHKRPEMYSTLKELYDKGLHLV